MKTVAVESQKGGTGKTTTALNLAVAAEKAGQTTVVIDLDPQASAAGWKDTRQAGSPVVVAVPPARLPQALQAAQEGGAALAVIDTAPHAESASLAAAKAADLIPIPCRPGILDLRAIGTTAEIVKLAGKPAFVVLNAIPPGATRLLADARAAVAVHGLAVASVAIEQRAAFGHAPWLGRQRRSLSRRERPATRLRSFTIGAKPSSITNICRIASLLAIRQFGNAAIRQWDESDSASKPCGNDAAGCIEASGY